MSLYDEVLQHLPQDVSQAMTLAQLFKVCKAFDTSKDVSTSLSQLYKMGRINRKVSPSGTGGMYLYWNKPAAEAETEVIQEKAAEVKPSLPTPPEPQSKGNDDFQNIPRSAMSHGPSFGMTIESFIKAIDKDKVGDNKVITQYPTIKLDVAIQIPEMPNTLKLVGLKKANLDDALATGEHYIIDVATLDDVAIEQFTAQWAIKFKAHVVARKQLSGGK